MVDEHSVLVVVFQFQPIIDVWRCYYVEMAALRGDCHFAIVVFGDVYFLRYGYHGGVCSHVIGVVNPNRIVTIGTHSDKSALVSHSQDGVNAVYLVVSLYVAFDGRRGRLYDFLEEIVHLFVGAACRKGRKDDAHCRCFKVYMLHYIVAFVALYGER